MKDFSEPSMDERLRSLADMPIIPQLHERFMGEYKVSSFDDVLLPKLEGKQVAVVAGAFFGDEGKGKTVDSLMPWADGVYRTNSGPNAGHTVDGHVFHLVPSGLFTGKPSFIGENCVMDPVSFADGEIGKIVAAGVEYDNLLVGNVFITNPYHKIIDALGTINSSTLKGISPSHASKARKRGLRLNDLFAAPSEQRAWLKKDLAFYKALVEDEGELLDAFGKMNEKRTVIPDHIMGFLRSSDKEGYIIGLYEEHVVENKAFPRLGDVAREVRGILAVGGRMLLEGPQSYFLSNQVSKHWRSSTSADTTAAGIRAAAGYNQELHPSLTINVHKNPASSRVGLGANPAGFVPQDYFSSRGITCLDDLVGLCDDFDSIQRQYFASVGDNGILRQIRYHDPSGVDLPISAAMAIASAKTYGERGATTMKPRVTGMFDLVAHAHVNRVQGPNLTISAVDRGDVTDHVGLVVAYAVSNPVGDRLISDGHSYAHGDVILPGEHFPNENVLKHCVPIIKVLDGWKNSPIAAGAFSGDRLPAAVNHFLAEIEHYTGADIVSIGNGPKTKNLLYVQK